jgi:hypothetical protein
MEKLSATARPQQASAPPPEDTSTLSRSATSSHRSDVSAPTSFVSSTTFPTPSLSTSHPQLASRQPSASNAASFTTHNNPPHLRSPRVSAVLRHGGPSTRGRHSISPMAPDAARAPPLEVQGPPRYLRERGLTPTTSVLAARRSRRRHRRGSSSGGSSSSGVSRATPEKNVPAAKAKKWGSHRGKSAGHASSGTSHTPSPRAVSTVHSSDGRGRRSSKQHRGRLINTDGEGGVVTPSESRRHHHQQRQRPSSRLRSREKDHGSSHHGREEEKPSKNNGAEGLTDDPAPAKEARRRSRGAVVAPAYDTFDALNATSTPPPLQVPTLTVRQLEEQKRLLEQQRAQQLQWNVQHEPSSVSFRSLQSRPAVPPGPAGRFGLPGGGGGGDGGSADPIRAPPPRATSPSNRPHQRSSFGGVGDDDAGGPAHQQTRRPNSMVGDDIDVDLAVPVLSAHGRKERTWPLALHVAAGGESGPPGPAAWSAAGAPGRAGGGGGGAPAVSLHRYERWEEEEERRERGAAVSVAARRSGRTTSSALQRQPSSRPAEPLQHPSCRFGLPASSNDRSAREQPKSTSRGTAAAPAVTIPAAPSPQLAGTSPILHSYVAQSFSSYLPGSSTMLGRTTATASQQLQQQQRLTTASDSDPSRRKEAQGQRASSGTAVGLEVAVMAERVAELPPPDVLEHYDALWRQCEARQQHRGGNPSSNSDVAALFSLVVHITLPYQTVAATASPVGAAIPARQLVTVGDVKDEVALRTGIPSSQQCLVYEAMSLQDSLPVHLLLSADDDEEEADADGASAGRCLRLLCIPLMADAELRWPSRKRHHGVASPGSEARSLATEQNSVAGERGKGGGDSVDDLRSLLLLSPARHGVSSAHAQSQQQQQQKQQVVVGREGNSEAAPATRRGAVPFFLSHLPTTTATVSAATRSINRIDDGAAWQRRDAQAVEPDAAVMQHIERLRRLYLDNGANSTSFSSGTTAAAATQAVVSAAPASVASSVFPGPREYLFNAEYQLNSSGRVEHADPAVHALQQRLLLSQLTAPSSAVHSTSVSPAVQGSAWARMTHTRGSDGGVVAAAASPASAALSDALIAALPAPPVRQSSTSCDERIVRGRPTPRGAAPFLPPQQQQQHQQRQQEFAATLAAPLRFASDPLVATTPLTFGVTTAAAVTAGVAPMSSKISVLRRTTHRLPAGGEEGDLDSEGSGGGVGASWLESARTSVSSHPAVMDEVEVAMSQAASTLNY